MKPTLYITGFFISTLSISTLVFAADQAAPGAKTMPMNESSTESMPMNESSAESMPMDKSGAQHMDMATDAQPAAATDTTEQAGFSRGSVVRSIFTSAIQDREPIDKLNNAASDTDQVFYFTELRDMSGQTATHRWEHDGKVIAEVKFDVRGPRWRVWSSKSFVPTTAGDWKVSVVNGAGETISEELISLSQIPDQNNAAQMPMNDSMESKDSMGMGSSMNTTGEPAETESGMNHDSSKMPMGSE
ncbi:hypothetical protein MNBD_GAMMA21-2691 [hydrothermal vent metagenome]|uniref:DUF2914 domain-containing protein n=1 Tax=hydrothermal vent metagenome TaxID=652676 RepID=A0A3B1ANU8_9ZZZZ